jgi:hypothetical protein
MAGRDALVGQLSDALHGGGKLAIARISFLHSALLTNRVLAWQKGGPPPATKPSTNPRARGPTSSGTCRCSLVPGPLLQGQPNPAPIVESKTPTSCLSLYYQHTVAYSAP